MPKTEKKRGGNEKNGDGVTEIHLEVFSSANSQREDIGYSLMEARVGTCMMMMVMMAAMVMMSSGVWKPEFAARTKIT